MFSYVPVSLWSGMMNQQKSKKGANHFLWGLMIPVSNSWNPKRILWLLRVKKMYGTSFWKIGMMLVLVVFCNCIRDNANKCYCSVFKSVCWTEIVVDGWIRNLWNVSLYYVYFTCVGSDGSNVKLRRKQLLGEGNAKEKPFIWGKLMLHILLKQLFWYWYVLSQHVISCGVEHWM